MGLLTKALGLEPDQTAIAERQELQKIVDDLSHKLSDIELDAHVDMHTKLMDPMQSGSLNYYGAIQQDLDIPELQRLFTTEGWFYIVVSTIAKTVSALPMKIERKKLTTNTDGSQVESWEDASGEPEQRLFRNPNDIMTAIEFWWLTICDVLSTGNAYMYVDYTVSAPPNPLANGRVAAPRMSTQGLYRINPSMIEPIPGKDKIYIDGYAMKLGQEMIRFAPEQIIHIKLPNPVDPYIGLAPIVPVYKNVLIDRYSSEHMIRFYKQGARLGGVVTTGQKLSKDQLARLQRSFEQDFTGRHNHHRTLILPSGMDYKTIEQNPGESSLIEFQKANREPILSAYNVPPIKVGLLDGATYANAIVQQKVFFVDTIMPLLTLIEQALNKHEALLAPERMLRVKYDLSQIEALQENQKELADIARTMLEGGLSVDEVRQRIWKLKPAPGGEIVPAIARASANSFGMGATTPVTAAAPHTQQTKEDAPQDDDIIDEALEIVQSVAGGDIPRDSGLQLLMLLGVDQAGAELILGSSGQNVPRGTNADAKDSSTAPGTVPGTQPDSALIGADVESTTATFNERVSQLASIYIAQGMSAAVAISSAIDQAILEGFVPGDKAKSKDAETESCDGRHVHNYAESAEKTEIDGAHKHAFLLPDGRIVWSDVDGVHMHDDVSAEGSSKPSGAHTHKVVVSDAQTVEIAASGDHTHEYLAAATTLSGEHVHVLKMPDGQEITSLTAADLQQQKESQHGKEETGQKETQGQKEEALNALPFTKDQLDAHWKQMSESGIEHLFKKRVDELSAFGTALGKLYRKKFEKNLRKYGIFHFVPKVKAQGDDGIVDEDSLDALLAAESENIAGGSYADAAKYGFKSNLVQFELNYPDEYANEQISKTAAQNVKYVSDTVKSDIRSIITAATESATSVQEISNQIRDYFGEKFSEGRATTIVRTEVLQAVSIGQDTKTREFKKEFPKEAKSLRKVWITSRDDRVRGNPDGLYPAKNADDADHFSLDLQVKEYDEPFDNGLMYPRDRKGEAKQVINCRCAWMTFLAADEADVREILAEGSPAADAEVPEKHAHCDHIEIKCIDLPPRKWSQKGSVK